MPHKRVGRVTHYYDHARVAALDLSDTLRLGDWLHFVGYTTDLAQQITSLQIDHRPVSEAEPGQQVGVSVNERVREHDVVYHITANEAHELLEERALEWER